MSQDWDYMFVTEVFGTNHTENHREEVEVFRCAACAALVVSQQEDAHQRWHDTITRALGEVS